MKASRLRERARALKRDVPAVYLALRDRQTPWYAKALAALTVAYALSPIDLVPDFIPVLGLLDDVILLPAMVALTARLIPRDVWARSQKNAERLWADGKPRKWYFALPIAAVWLLAIWLIVRALWLKG